MSSMLRLVRASRRLSQSVFATPGISSGSNGEPPRRRPAVLAVGEVNPYGSRPSLALWCEPRRASGDRLRRIMGLTDEQYLEHVARVNLCDDKKWNAKLARKRFNAIDRTGLAVIILLGAKVREALLGPPPFKITSVPDSGAWLVGLPHPSGRCRAWNDADAALRARAILENLVPQIPWGSADDRM